MIDEVNHLTDEESSFEEKDDKFYEHFDIDKMITYSCIAINCNKLMDKKFMLKKIPSCAFEIQEYINYQINGNKKVTNLGPSDQAGDFKLADSWLNISPQIPTQNFVQCYGAI